MDRKYKYLAFLCALFIFSSVLRFGWPNFITFGPDMGLLQLIADRYFDQQIWPLVGLIGTKSVYYGPLPSWIYIFLRSIAPQSLPVEYWLFFCLNIFHIASLGYFLAGIKQVLKVKTTLFIVFFILSLPILVFYARLPWDNTFLICFTNLFSGYYFRALNRDHPTTRTLMYMWVIGGLCAGGAIAIHLMSFPLACGILFACWTLSTSEKKLKVLGPCLFIATASIFVLPYLYGLLTASPIVSEVSTKEFKPLRWLLGLRSVVIQWSSWATWSGFLNYFTSREELMVLDSALATPKFVNRGFYGISIALQFILAALCLYATSQWLRLRLWCVSIAHQQLLTFMFILSAGHTAMAVIGDATTHPHYFQAIWWVPIVSLGLWMDQVASHRLKSLSYFILAAIVGMNLIFTPILGRFFYKSEGYPASALGPSLHLQQKSIRELCSFGKDTIGVDIENKGITYPAIRWNAHHESRCRDIKFRLSQPACGWISYYKLYPTPHIEWKDQGEDATLCKKDVTN